MKLPCAAALLSMLVVAEIDPVVPHIAKNCSGTSNQNWGIDAKAGTIKNGKGMCLEPMEVAGTWTAALVPCSASPKAAWVVHGGTANSMWLASKDPHCLQTLPNKQYIADKKTCKNYCTDQTGHCCKGCAADGCLACNVSKIFHCTDYCSCSTTDPPTPAPPPPLGE